MLGLQRRGVPVRIGRGEVGELRRAKAELLAGLIWGGEVRRSEFDSKGELVGVDMGGSSVPSSGSGEMAKERGMKLSGVLVVRLRARNEALGCCSGRSTAGRRR